MSAHLSEALCILGPDDSCRRPATEREATEAADRVALTPIMVNNMFEVIVVATLQPQSEDREGEVA